MFSSLLQAAEDTSNSTSFNPFMVTDSVPSLLLDSPNSVKPIHKVLDYFQKQSCLDGKEETVSDDLKKHQ